MKRLLILIGLLAVLVLPAGAEALEISTPEELAAMEPGGEYILTEDLDMTGVFWQCFPFSGTLDGNGHSILNLNITEPGLETGPSVDGNQKEYETSFAGLFSTLEQGTVKNLNLINVRALVVRDDPCFVGAVAGCSREGTIENCTIQGTLELRAHDRMFGVGGVVGYGSGTVENCRVDVTLICTDTDASTLDEQFLGGVFSTGFMSVKNCEITIDGYDSEHGYVHNGGITGMFMQYPIGIGQQGDITDNVINGKITFFEDNGNRRAYCSAVAGEQIQIYTYSIKNNTGDFLRDERREFDRELRPEMCEEPRYTETVVSGGCGSYGYTEYTCEGCGYSYRDRYTLFVHSVTEWAITEPPTTEQTGLSVGSCDLCDAKETRVEETLPPETEPETVPAETLQAEPEESADMGMKMPWFVIGISVAMLIPCVVLLVMIKIRNWW